MFSKMIDRVFGKGQSNAAPAGLPASKDAPIDPAHFLANLDNMFAARTRDRADDWRRQYVEIMARVSSPRPAGFDDLISNFSESLPEDHNDDQVMGVPIAKLNQTERTALFRFLLDNRSAVNGRDAALERLSASAAANKISIYDIRPFAIQWEIAIARLALTPLDYDAELARRVLSCLADAQIGISFCKKGTFYPRPGDTYGKMPIFRYLHTVLAPLAADEPQIRKDAQRVLEIYREGSADLLANDTSAALRREVLQLRELAGFSAQPGFFARHCAHPNQHTLQFTYWDPRLADMTELVLPVLAQMRADLIAHDTALASRSMPPITWLTDADAYTAMFPVTEDRPFQWWKACDTDPFAILRTTEETLQTVEQYQSERAELEAFVAPSPVSFVSNHPPNLAWLAFDGADPDGALVDHMVQAEAAKPNAKWLKTTDAHLSRIGRDRALAGLQHWAAQLTERELPVVDECLFQMHNTFSMRTNFAFDRKQSPAPHEFSAAGAADWAMSTVQNERLQRMLDFPNRRQIPSLESLTSYKRYQGQRDLARNANEAAYGDADVLLLTGIAWTLSRFGDEAITLLVALARDAYGSQRGLYSSGARSVKVGNACVWALGAIGTRQAAVALGRVRRSVRDKGVSNRVDKALSEAAKNTSLTAADMLELSFPDHEVGTTGRTLHRFGPFEIALTIVTSRRVTLRTRDTTAAKPVWKNGITKAALNHEPHPGAAAELKALAKELPKVLAEIRRHLEETWLSGRDWAFADWHDRLIDNQLAATLTTRLIWRFTKPDGSHTDLLWHPDGPLTHDGSTFTDDLTGSRVALWHPLDSDEATVQAWRELLMKLQVRQAFAQAFRPLYAITDAEHATRDHSNRFAAHLLEQPPFVSYLRNRGWTMKSRMAGYEADHQPNRKLFPHLGIAAEYAVAGASEADIPHDYGAPNYGYVATDRIQFRRMEGQEVVDEIVPLEDIPPRAFCETMRDVDAVVAITSIGNDRFWVDGGLEVRAQLLRELNLDQYRQNWTRSTRMVESRHAILRSIIKPLDVADRLELLADALLVRGNRHHYRIDLASSSVMRSADADALKTKGGHHICIVPKTTALDDLYLPVDDDGILMLVLSKALLLARDDKITDKVILGQM